jgi:hypothetical protein
MKLKSKLASGSVATVALAGLVFAATAIASSHHPTGEFAQFGECPLSRITITDCVYSAPSGGFTIGEKTVPLVNPVTLQGGFEGLGEEIKFYGAENGNTLSKTSQPVPGGLLGVAAPTWWPKFFQNRFNHRVHKGWTRLTATIELTGPTRGLTNVKLNTESLFLQEGTALALPVKIKLSNPILGNHCYIGSDKSPVQWNFTTGQSGGLHGSSGELSFNEAFTLITLTGSKLVDGTYTAPGASGCGGSFSFFVDPLVNSILGTPSPSGKNTAILEGRLQDANPEAVSASSERFVTGLWPIQGGER